MREEWAFGERGVGREGKETQVSGASWIRETNRERAESMEKRGVSKLKVGERRWVWEEMGVRTWIKKW